MLNSDALAVPRPPKNSGAATGDSVIYSATTSTPRVKNDTLFMLVHFGVNLIANYPNIVGYSLRYQLVQMSTTHSSVDQYCISHKTISHRAAAAPGREFPRECPMTY